MLTPWAAFGVQRKGTAALAHTGEEGGGQQWLLPSSTEPAEEGPQLGTRGLRWPSGHLEVFGPRVAAPAPRNTLA